MAQAADYSENGIKITPANPVAGKAVKITYSGLLAASGATEVYAHVGYNDGWEDVHDRPMQKTRAGFTTSVKPPSSAQTVNFCFFDPADNWDNNSGRDYRLDLHDVAAPSGWDSAEFAAELGGPAFTYRPARGGKPHGVRGWALTAARRLGAG